MKRLVLAIITVIVLLIIVIFVIRFWQINQNNQTQPSNSNADNESNLVIQGLVFDVKMNYNVSSDGVYHIFPAIVTVNITKFVWISDQLKYQAGKSPQFRDYSWQNKTSIIAYDRFDVPNLIKGQLIEAKGYYYSGGPLFVYNNKLVIEPTITDSYLKSLS